VARNLQNQDLDWLQGLLTTNADSSIERAIISGIIEGPLAQGKIICACKQIGINSINEAIKKNKLNSAAEIGKCTGAGTGCGSCLPDIEDLLVDYYQLVMS